MTEEKLGESQARRAGNSTFGILRALAHTHFLVQVCRLLCPFFKDPILAACLTAVRCTFEDSTVTWDRARTLMLTVAAPMPPGNPVSLGLAQPIYLYDTLKPLIFRDLLSGCFHFQSARAEISSRPDPNHECPNAQ